MNAGLTIVEKMVNVRTQWEASSATVMMVIWKIKSTSVLVSNVYSLLEKD